jgi:HPt (histidine-containing phosphotransfer) domain-containing protein
MVPTGRHPFDIADLFDRCGRDTTLAVEVMSLFGPATTDARDRLRKALGDVQLRDAAEAAHSLASTLGNVGAREASLLARVLRRSLADARLEEGQVLLRLLDQQIALVESEVARVLARCRPADEASR